MIRWVPVLIVVALIGAAMLAAAASDIPFTRGPALPPSPPPVPTGEQAQSTPPPPSGFGVARPTPDVPAWIAEALTVLCMAAIVILAVALLWAVLRDRLTV